LVAILRESFFRRRRLSQNKNETIEVYYQEKAYQNSELVICFFIEFSLGLVLVGFKYKHYLWRIMTKEKPLQKTNAGA